jgi:hypothetical protein
MKNLALKILLLSCIVLLFASCKKETLYQVYIDVAGWPTYIEYSINGATAVTITDDAIFDAKEGDVIRVTGYPAIATMPWNFTVFCYRYERGEKADKFNVIEMGLSTDPNDQTVIITLPH